LSRLAGEAQWLLFFIKILCRQPQILCLV
jgi:hypothetical protein